MMTAEHVGQYDAYATEYRATSARRERGGVDGDRLGILPRPLEWLGDVAGLRVLDAGSILPPGGRFPIFMLVALVKDHAAG